MTTIYPPLESKTDTEPACSAASLKRKRPPMIQIPNVLQEIQMNNSNTPRDTLSFSQAGVAVFSLKGKKKFMEDTYKIASSSTSSKSFFGVFDGHGGRMAADFVAENLHTNVFEVMENCKEDYQKLDAIKAVYLKTDQEFLKQGLASGACCVTALIEGQQVVVSNVGDCRAVLCRGGVAEALTVDHTAEREDERKRIENQGGYVEVHRGAWRVHGVLSVSRSIGDAHLKNWVVAEPDTRIVEVAPDSEFLVLASDGLWGKVGNQEAVDMVKKLVGKTSGPQGDCIKDDGDFTCVNASPSSKLRRTMLVKQPKEMSLSPLGTHSKENQSPSKFRRLSVVKQLKETGQSLQGDFNNENEADFGRVNVSPSSKLRRVSLLKLPKETSTSPVLTKTADNHKDTEVDSTPPLKSRRISMVKRIDVKVESSKQENNNDCKKSPAAVALAVACKELANLSLTRGCLDDITVMIIDLNHFRRNN